MNTLSSTHSSGGSLLETTGVQRRATVGAIGSRRTHRHRLDRLREAGLGDTELARLHSPIGLDLGARTPEETAIAIAAEIVAHRRGGGCLPLSATDTPIHHEPSRHTIPTPERAARQASSAFAW